MRVRMIWRAAAMTGAAALTMATAAACGSSAGSAGGSGPVSITFWTSGLPAETNWIVSHFNATHPGIKVQGQYIASSDESAAKEIAALKTNTEPNVILGQDPAALPLLAESGKVVDLRGPLKSETDALYPGIKSALFYQGKQLGMALGGVGDYVLFYNKKDFAAAGIKAPPKTWAQLEADAIRLSDPARRHYGVYIPFGTDEWISYDWESLLWSNGGQLLNAAGTKTAFDSPAGVAALTTWVNLVRKDHAAPTVSYAQAGSYDGAPAFASGAVSMIVEGQWALAEFKNDDYGVAPMPAGTTGHASTGIGIGTAAVFDHGGAANDAATTFVKWLAQPAQGAYITSVTSGLPAAPAQLTQPAVKKEAASQPTYGVFAGQLPTGRTRPTVPAYTAISKDLATEINAALDGAVTPAQALAKAAAEGDAAIAADAAGS